MPTITLQKEDEMIALGAYCAKQLPPRCVCYLMGDLGAGKTTWMKGIIKGLGSDEILRSPTYPIVQHYSVNNKQLAHFDLYRLHGADDFLDSGLGDQLDEDYVFIEWPRRAKECLPAPDFELTFQVTGTDHTISMDDAGFEQLRLKTYL
jgi:tRNA threonylcarbamoyladenosine biosynthesis protein TsaE